MLRNHGIFDYKIEMGGASYPTDQLWAIWRFNNAVTDSYSSHNLTNNPASYEDGGFPTSYAKSAATFSGSVPTITDNTFMPIGVGLSLSMWIYPKSAGPTGKICGCAGNIYGRCGISISIWPTGLWWGKERSGFFGPIGNTSFSTRDAWVHLVMTTADGNTFKFYINNVKGTDATNTVDLNYNVFNVGNITAGSEYLSNCKVASMFVYKKALSDEEISQLWNGGAGI